MSNLYAPESFVIEFETGEPSRFFCIKPNRLPGDRWVHDLDEFDRSQSRDSVIDKFVLPSSDKYTVQLLTVPPGTAMQMGDIASRDDQSGGGNLVEVLDHETIPDSWIDETTTLDEFLE